MGCVKVFTDNWLDPAVLAGSTVTSVNASYPEENLYDNKRYKKFRTTSASAQRITWDLGFPGNPKGFVAISDRNIPLKISPMATIKLEGNSTNAWGTPEFSVTIPWRDYVLGIWSSTGLHTSALRYWSLYIDDPLNPYSYIELGEVFLGDWVELTRGCMIYPFTSRVNDNSVQFTSEGGQKHAIRRAKGQQFQVEWRGLKKEELEELEDIFNYFGIHTPFFMSFDSDGAFSTEKESWLRFVRFKDSNSDFQLSSPNNFGMTYEMEEEL